MHLPDSAGNDARLALPMPEAVLLWAIRTWVSGRRQEAPAERRIGPVFATLGAPDAAGFLYGLMWVLSHGAGRSIEVRCPCHPWIGKDEQTLLDALVLTQDGQLFERLLLFRSLLRPLAATPAGQSASGLVEAFNRAGLFLTPCYAPVRHHAFPRPAWRGFDRRRAAGAG